MTQRLHSQRGISLVEALVAVAVLAFGVLGVAGMQLTLRQSADVAKQRTEAVRIAQATIENARGYWLIDHDPTYPDHAFDDIADDTFDQTPVIGNATYTGTLASPALNLDPADPDNWKLLRLKRVRIDVAWNDRTGPQGPVSLATLIARVPPSLAGALAVPAGEAAVARPRGRNPGIPPGADDAGRFVPPGQPDDSYIVFNNLGLITTCHLPTDYCPDLTHGGMLISGYVRFDDHVPTTTTPSSSENPTGTAPPTYLYDGSPPAWNATGTRGVGVWYDGSTAARCLVSAYLAAPDFVAYYCIVPLNADGKWSGSVWIDDAPLTTPPPQPVRTPAGRKVCRYTPQIAAGSNAGHPAAYTGLETSLADQNFLVIRDAASCSNLDDPTTPYVDGTTQQHQPVP